MSVRKQYQVTERAGEWVAGQRRPESGRLMLTDRQAAYELALGTIQPVAPRKRARRAASEKKDG